MRDSFLDWLFGQDGKAVVAGAFGGLLRWLTLKTSIRDGIVSIIAGALCAAYLGPLAVPIIDAVFGRIVVDEDSRSSLAGFLMGVSGVGLSSIITDIFLARLRLLKGAPANDVDKQQRGS